jgi:hypothetical protein
MAKKRAKKAKKPAKKKKKRAAKKAAKSRSVRRSARKSAAKKGGAGKKKRRAGVAKAMTEQASVGAAPAAASTEATQGVKTALNPAAAWPFPTGSRP